MQRRPWPVVILALFHVLAPFANIAISARVQNLGLQDYLRALVADGWMAVIVTGALLPIAGAAIFLMKRWSYPLFLVIMAIMTICNFLTWQVAPQMMSLRLVLGFTFINVIVVSYFLIPAVRAGFMDSRLRWWESKPRFDLGLEAQLRDGQTVYPCTIENLSEGGALIRSKETLKFNSAVTLEFKLLQLEVQQQSRLVHGSAQGGYGLEFDHSRQSHRQFSRIVHGLELLGAMQRGAPAPWYRELGQWSARLLRTGRGLVPELPASRRKSG